MGSESKNHELGHAKQAAYYKRWIYYYLVYCWEWLKGNPFTGIGAYYTIPFEIQAYGNQHNSTYDYNRSDLKSKYTIKKRRSVYKKYKYGWKNYCKSL